MHRTRGTAAGSVGFLIGSGTVSYRNVFSVLPVYLYVFKMYPVRVCISNVFQYLWCIAVYLDIECKYVANTCNTF